jgi:hypothetical protein
MSGFVMNVPKPLFYIVAGIVVVLCVAAAVWLR